MSRGEELLHLTTREFSPGVPLTERVSGETEEEADGSGAGGEVVVGGLEAKRDDGGLAIVVAVGGGGMAIVEAGGDGFLDALGFGRG